MASVSRWGRLWSVLLVPSVIGLSVVLFGVYSWFDLRAAGLRSSLTTTQVTNYLARVRRRFRERALETLRALCGSEAEFRREARDLFGLEVE